MLRNVALYGRSGSGKSTIAELLTRQGYQHIKTGAACRKLCLDLFDSDAKTLMNQVTDALRAIDQTVWLRAALREALSPPFIFDSMRFPQDYVRLRDEDYLLVRVEAPRQERIRRLAARGQEYEPERDDVHDAEVSLDTYDFDLVVINSGGLSELEGHVTQILDAARTD